MTFGAIGALRVSLYVKRGVGLLYEAYKMSTVGRVASSIFWFIFFFFD